MNVSLDNFNYHIIDVDLKIFTYLMDEDNIHEALVGGVIVLF